MHTTLLNEIEAACFLHVSRSFMAQQRMKGTGPVFIKIGRSVRYSIENLQAWIASQSRKNTIYLQPGTLEADDREGM